jgi:hypothetical protein
LSKVEEAVTHPMMRFQSSGRSGAIMVNVCGFQMVVVVLLRLEVCMLRQFDLRETLSTALLSKGIH